jgi:hypothetical protein
MLNCRWKKLPKGWTSGEDKKEPLWRTETSYGITPSHTLQNVAVDSNLIVTFKMFMEIPFFILQWEFWITLFHSS